MATRPISYEQQVSPSGGARMGFASDEAFGAGLGRDIGAAGGAVLNAAQRREDERDTLDWNARAAELRGWSDQTADQLRSTSGPGGAGHVDAVLKAYDEQVTPMLAAISNPRVKAEAEADVRASRASLAAREDVWARGQSIGKAFTDLGNQVDAAANRLSTNPSATALGEELDAFDNSIETLTGPADAKAEFAKKQRERIAVAYAEALDPKVRKQILDQGGLNEFLSPERLTSLKSGTDVDIRTMDAQARTLASLGKAEARDQVDSVIRMAGDGVPLPDADLEKTQQLAAQWGFDAKVYNVAALRVKNNLNRETKAWTPQQFSSQINVLEQKISAAGDKAETADVLARDHLVTLRDKRLSTLKDHPDQFLASIGRPEAPINWDDPSTTTPAALALRARTRRALAAETGTPLSLLSDVEAQPIIDMIRSDSGAQRLEAASKIALFGRDAAAVMQQVAAGDDAFRTAASLGRLPDGGRAMRDAFNGHDALKANPGLTKVDPGAPPPGEVFATNTATALRAVPPAVRAATLETATNIYAARMARAGKTAWDEGTFLGAVQTALGGMNLNGQWTGGVVPYRDSTVLLPTKMTQTDFEHRIARASAEDWVRAANGAPVHRSGAPVFTGELRGMQPVAIGDGIYAFMNGKNTYVLNRNGQRYEIDVRKLPGGR